MTESVASGCLVVIITVTTSGGIGGFGLGGKEKTVETDRLEAPLRQQICDRFDPAGREPDRSRLRGTIAIEDLKARTARRAEREGYDAAQLGFAPAKPRRVSKPSAGQFTKAGTGAFSVLREFRFGDGEPPAVGSEVKVSDVFQPGQRVHVTGVSKGRGTAGVIKRHHFSGFPATHGTHEYFRHGGSIGNRSFPGRVFKGKRMPGRMGGERVTTLNLEVVEVDSERGLCAFRIAGCSPPELASPSLRHCPACPGNPELAPAKGGRLAPARRLSGQRRERRRGFS